MKIIVNNYKIHPKQRPRFLGGRVYSPSGAEETALALLIRSQVEGELQQFTKTVRVSIIIKARDRLRGDLDNYEKLVWDSLQKAGVLANDKLVRENACKVLEHSDCDRLEIEIRPLVSDEIKALRSQGKSIRDIAKQVSLCKSYVHRIITNASPRRGQ